MFQFRLRLISAVLALVSIGLFASLLPRTSFVAQSSGQVVDGIGPIWPDSAVEQTLSDAPGIVSEIRIWAAAGFDRGEAPIVASLLQAGAEEPVRQVRVAIVPSKLLAPYVLVFPPYRPPPGEKLMLQLWISTERDNYVIFGASEPGTGIAPPAINRQPTDQGPLAYEFIWTGASWRAALEGSIPDLARLAGAIAAALMALALRLSIFRILHRTTRQVRLALLNLFGPVRRTLLRARTSRISQLLDAEAPSKRRSFYVFPWFIPAFAILHYLAHNLLLFPVWAAIAVTVVTMMVVTAAFVAFRLIFKTAAVAAVLTGLLGIAFFSYGHVYVALGDRADDRYLFGLGVPVVLSLGALVIRRPELARRIRSMLNVGSIVVLMAPTYQIAFHFYAESSVQTNRDTRGLVKVDETVAKAKIRLAGNELRDIYYIILDQYPQSGSPPSFDNSEFVHELESRGFFVAPQARSNYAYTFSSIPSSLNMRYVGEDDKRDERETRHLAELVHDHALGRILKGLGYQYVHISSGWFFTQTNTNADVLVDFAPSGPLRSKPKKQDPFSFERATRLSTRFTDGFLRTTSAKPFLSHEFGAEPSGPVAYFWKNPSWTLAWLDFMKEVGTMERPKFVFAHILKPHSPHSFDKYGNVSFERKGWPDDHDPTVPSAFFGQIIWLNARMLEVIDAILDDYQEPPIIVIAGDHGYQRSNPSTGNAILAAFLLPDGGESAVYPSITSVNHFRSILDYYFELDLGLLEDKVYIDER